MTSPLEGGRVGTAGGVGSIILLNVNSAQQYTLVKVQEIFLQDVQNTKPDIGMGRPPPLF